VLDPDAIEATVRVHGSFSAQSLDQRPILSTHVRGCQLLPYDPRPLPKAVHRCLTEVAQALVAALTESSTPVYVRCTKTLESVSCESKQQRGMSAQRFLIRNGFVVSMDRDVGDVTA
jgi:hypothetical protein